MKNMIVSFKETFGLYRKDKVSLLFALIPILIGIILFAYFGLWAYGAGNDLGEKWIRQMVDGENKFLSFLLQMTITVLIFFLVNYTFVIIVSILASPFNDIISSRFEKILGGKQPVGLKESFSQVMKGLIRTVFNEIKKMSVILFLVVLAFALGLFPILFPFSLAVSGLLVAVGFLDYSWSRHGLKSRACLKHTTSNLFPFTVSGLLFMGLISIPLINMFVLPFAVGYYTILFVKNPPQLETPLV